MSVVPDACASRSYITADRTDCVKCTADYQCDGTESRIFKLSLFSTFNLSTVSGLVSASIVLVALGVVLVIACVVRRKKRSPANDTSKTMNRRELYSGYPV